ncbi:MAG: hypothetical protein C0183_02870 [Roseiflexus castenholzii]|nr:MAG: hypothetical protein C0183_02870 [Roseiflexus castenholzii]
MAKPNLRGGLERWRVGRAQLHHCRIGRQMIDDVPHYDMQCAGEIVAVNDCLIDQAQKRGITVQGSDAIVHLYPLKRQPYHPRHGLDHHNPIRLHALRQRVGNQKNAGDACRRANRDTNASPLRRHTPNDRRTLECCGGQLAHRQRLSSRERLSHDTFARLDRHISERLQPVGCGNQAQIIILALPQPDRAGRNLQNGERLIKEGAKFVMRCL